MGTVNNVADVAIDVSPSASSPPYIGSMGAVYDPMRRQDRGTMVEIDRDLSTAAEPLAWTTAHAQNGQY